MEVTQPPGPLFLTLCVAVPSGHDTEAGVEVSWQRKAFVGVTVF